MNENVKLAERLEKQAEDMRIQQNLGSYADTCEEAARVLRSPSPAQGTVLPEAVKAALARFAPLRISVAQADRNPKVFTAIMDYITVSADTPEAAIDALAKQLEAGGR